MRTVRPKSLKIGAEEFAYFDTSIALKSIPGIQAITANGINVPFENGSSFNKGGKYLIPIASLIECSNPNGQVRVKLFHNEKCKAEILLDLGKHKLNLRIESIKKSENKLFTFAYQGISWNEKWDYRKVCSKKALSRYFDVGFDAIYDNRFHVKIEDQKLSKELLFELNNLRQFHKSLLLDDDLIHCLTSGEFQPSDATFKPYFEYGKDLKVGNSVLRFANRGELKSFLKKRLSIYIHHPQIYGINVVDEPAHDTIVSGLKEIYLALKECVKELGREDFYLYINLLPMSSWTGALAGEKETKNRDEDYKTYLLDYIDALGIDYLSYDLYPIKDECGNERQSPYAFENVMLAANIAKEKNVSLKVVTQTNTIAFPNQKIVNKRIVNYDDLKFLTNTLMGFGVNDISFFTYHYLNYSSPNEIWQKGNGFLINHNSKRTSLYYSTKQIIKELQSFYSYFSGFRYQYAYLFSDNEDERYRNASKHNAENIEEKLPFDIARKEAIFITNLKKGDIDLFMIQNPHNDKTKNKVADYQITFKKPIDHVQIMESGQFRMLKTVDNQIKIRLSSGRAVFMELGNE